MKQAIFDLKATLGSGRAISVALGHTSHSTVAKWFKNNRIPQNHWQNLKTIAAEKGCAIEIEDFMTEAPAELVSAKRRA